MTLNEFIDQLKKENLVDGDTEEIAEVVTDEVRNCYEGNCVCVDDETIKGYILNWKNLKEMHEKEKPKVESKPKYKSIDEVEKVKPKQPPKSLTNVVKHNGWEQEALF